MEHFDLLSFLAGFSAFLGFILGFFLGQKSVVLVGQRIETSKPSDSREVTQVSPVIHGKPDPIYDMDETSSAPSLVPPPRFRDLVMKNRNGGDN